MSSATASSAFAKGWRGINKTSTILQTVRNEGFRRVYSTNSSDGGNGFDPNSMGKGLPFHCRVINAWTQTPTKWYPIPIAGRAGSSPLVDVNQDGVEVIKLKGLWQGYLNSLELPPWFRPFGFQIYAFAFSCNLDEIDEEELKTYKSLGKFFYRKLKDGVRPVDDAVLVSPADGQILHFGTVQGSCVEQVKGITYSLDALLGIECPGTPPHPLLLPTVTPCYQ
ncbi:hypothetical protein BDP27DRAFT_1359125 [Rhodocollybia butyracea]|uniref:Uncharacterized protein n=1 Tax=Rhodocollybia butyracea TaxID=206335 RepID=A0A9P5UD74_9AGAR|nr:hypothetical protein BDP27DRAFT_1359125 [Rhodocollybia butyracea]